MEVINKMDILNTKTGNNEVPRNNLEAKPVKIVSVVMKEKNKEGKVMDSPLAQFFVKHPDKEELLTLTKVKFLEGEELKTKGFWVQLDKDGNFFKGSSIDLILKQLDVECLSDTYGKEIETVIESKDKPYLCLKAY